MVAQWYAKSQCRPLGPLFRFFFFFGGGEGGGGGRGGVTQTGSLFIPRLRLGQVIFVVQHTAQGCGTRKAVTSVLVLTAFTALLAAVYNILADWARVSTLYLSIQNAK